MFVLALVPLAGVAQTEAGKATATENILQHGYLRPSISVVYLHDGSHYAHELARMLSKGRYDKYDYNDVGRNVFSFSPTADTKGHKAVVDALVEEQDFGRKIMRNWFPKFDREQKGWDMEVVLARGRMAATDNDVMRNNASYLKTQLDNLGERLINRSYLLVVVIRGQEQKNSTKLQVDPFIYKLDFGPEVMTTFYEQYWDKADGINKCPFPMIFVANPNVPGIAKMLFDPSEFTITAKTKMEDVHRDAEEFVMTMASQGADELKVQSEILTTGPVRAKIGTKEGLVPGRRFDVMEQVQKGDKIVAKRKAAVRATRVLDNKGQVAMGDSTLIYNNKNTTRFAQFSGGRIREGMTLVEHRELGLSFAPVIGSGASGLSLEYRFSDLLAKWLPVSFGRFLRGTTAYVRFEEPYTLRDGFKLVSVADYPLVRMSVGVGKEFNFARFAFAQVQVGYSAFTVISTKKSESEKPSLPGTEAIDTGLRLGIYAKPNLQIFAYGNYSYALDKDLMKFWIEDNNPGYVPYNFGLGARLTF